MRLEIVKRDGFCICGYAVETNAANNDADLSQLFAYFFSEDREKSLLDLTGGKKGYYGLSWYTAGHESYYYLLGIEVAADAQPPDGAILKVIPPAEFAVARFSAEDDIMKAWTEFFYAAIPAEGYAPDEGHGYYFEFYPEDVHANYELWTPVVRSNA